jgi:hypothetical protein
MDMVTDNSKEFTAIEEHIRRNIAKEISGLEFPPEWRPNEVIRYIVRKIEKAS